MDIKVVVSERRKCAASIDWRAGDHIDDSHIQKLAVLSFGDRNEPETDVEILFTLNQLKELNSVVSEAVENFERKEHYGRC